MLYNKFLESSCYLWRLVAELKRRIYCWVGLMKILLARMWSKVACHHSAIAACVICFLFHSSFWLLCVEYVNLKALDQLSMLILFCGILVTLSASVVWTSVGLVSPFVDTSRVPLCGFHIFCYRRVWVFDGIFFFVTIWVYTMREPRYLGKIAIVSIWFRMVWTQIITWVYILSPGHTHQIWILDWYYNFDMQG